MLSKFSTVLLSGVMDLLYKDMVRQTVCPNLIVVTHLLLCYVLLVLGLCQSAHMSGVLDLAYNHDVIVAYLKVNSFSMLHKCTCVTGAETCFFTDLGAVTSLARAALFFTVSARFWRRLIRVLLHHV